MDMSFSVLDFIDDKILLADALKVAIIRSPNQSQRVDTTNRSYSLSIMTLFQDGTFSSSI